MVFTSIYWWQNMSEIDMAKLDVVQNLIRSLEREHINYLKTIDYELKTVDFTLSLMKKKYVTVDFERLEKYLAITIHEKIPRQVILNLVANSVNRVVIRCEKCKLSEYIGNHHLFVKRVDKIQITITFVETSRTISMHIYL